MRSNLREEPVWCEGSVRESWNRPRSSVQLKYGVISALRKKREQYQKFILLIRVVPPKSFGPYQGSGDFFYSIIKKEKEIRSWQKKRNL